MIAIEITLGLGLASLIYTCIFNGVWCADLSEAPWILLYGGARLRDFAIAIVIASAVAAISSVVYSVTMVFCGNVFTTRCLSGTLFGISFLFVFSMVCYVISDTGMKSIRFRVDSFMELAIVNQDLLDWILMKKCSSAVDCEAKIYEYVKQKSLKGRTGNVVSICLFCGCMVLFMVFTLMLGCVKPEENQKHRARKEDFIP